MPYRVLTGRRAIVTGASSGIGRAISCELVNRGANVVLVARRADRLEQLQTELAAKPGETQAVIGDVDSSRDALRQQVLPAEPSTVGKGWTSW